MAWQCLLRKSLLRSVYSTVAWQNLNRIVGGDGSGRFWITERALEGGICMIGIAVGRLRYYLEVTVAW